MRFHRYARFAGIAAAGALALTACGGANAGASNGGNGSELSGTVKIDGSSTVFPMTAVAAEQFMQKTGVRVTVNASGTGGGFEKFCRGKTDINDASRPIAPEEQRVCAKNGIEYEQFTIAGDAITVIVNEQNTWAQCLTVDQLRKIWKPGSTVDSWTDIDPAYPDVPLELFGPGTDSGTFDYFTEVVVGTEGESRTDYASSEDDNVIVRGVAGTKGGLGYLGYSYYIENKDQLNAVKIDSSNGCVAPTIENAQSGAYEPLSRPLFIYPNKAAVQRDEVAAFVRYYIRHAQGIAKAQGFVPLSDEQQAGLLDQLAKLTGSS